jgi:hypothetical protein
MNPNAQDPEAQNGLDTWIMDIQAYFKDNILSVAKRYTLVEGDLGGILT